MVLVVKLRAIPLSTITTLGAGADLPTAGLVNPIDRSLVHQEESVTILLNAGLQSIGSGDGPIASTRLAVHEKNSFSPLSAKDKASFDYIRKHENGHCFRLTLGRSWILCHQLL